MEERKMDEQPKLAGYYWIKTHPGAMWEVARYNSNEDGPAWWFTGWDIPERNDPSLVGAIIPEPSPREPEEPK